MVTVLELFPVCKKKKSSKMVKHKQNRPKKLLAHVKLVPSTTFINEK